MDKAENRIWGIRAGKKGEAHRLFLDGGVIALEDAGLGNLSVLESTREAFYAAYRKLHPGETRTGSAGIGGKYYRFAHEIQIGDLVIYASLPDKIMYIATVIGPYTFRRSSKFSHQRNVKWEWKIPKAGFSQETQYELGAARTFFEFKKNRAELIAKLEEKSTQHFTENAEVK